ncbi:hypothetical protein ABH14_25260 [Brevibacillus brevis]|uniref:hypothetical protein n=1 Tax=Brevibacillus brevis TaxID=1393 RepID=UPI001901CEC5|nr:hypothetical protein [Brevibacillus brevis]MBH0333016.1 hypothetical protein [Brevibacillus brevis]
MYLKKLLSMLLVLLLLVSSTLVNVSVANEVVEPAQEMEQVQDANIDVEEEQDQIKEEDPGVQEVEQVQEAEQAQEETYTEYINLEDIRDHPDVLEFMIKHGYDKEVYENSLNEEIRSMSSQDSDRKYPEIEGYTPEQVKDVYNRYDLWPTEEIQNISEEVTVVRSKADNQIVGAWIITLSRNLVNWTDTKIYASVANFGSNVTQVTGTITKYHLNGKNGNWVADRSVHIAQNLKGNGVFYTWDTPIAAVKDSFEYDLVIVDKGIKHPRNSNGEKHPFRYNFDVEPYNKLAALGGQRHHFVSRDALSRGGYDSNLAPAVRMLVSDHYNTPNYGGATKYRDEELVLLNAGKFEELLEKEIQGFKDAKDSEEIYSNLFTKYQAKSNGEAITELVLLYEDYLVRHRP